MFAWVHSDARTGHGVHSGSGGFSFARIGIGTFNRVRVCSFRGRLLFAVFILERIGSFRRIWGSVHSDWCGFNWVSVGVHGFIPIHECSLRCVYVSPGSFRSACVHFCTRRVAEFIRIRAGSFGRLYLSPCSFVSAWDNNGACGGGKVHSISRWLIRPRVWIAGLILVRVGSIARA